MSIQSDVANSGLDQAAIAQIYTSEMKSYRNVLMHMEADWKATPEYCGLSDHKTDMQMYERLWSGISDDGIGSPRGWAFVEKHFGDFDPEMQGRIQFLLRREINLPTDLAKDAERRLTDIGATPSAINIPLAMDVSR